MSPRLHTVTVKPWHPYGGPQEAVAEVTGTVRLDALGSNTFPSGGDGHKIDVFPLVDVLDCDSDPCRIARLELRCSTVDLGWWPRTLHVVGYLEELRVAETVADGDDGPRYVPEVAPDWVPRLVAVTITEADR